MGEREKRREREIKGKETDLRWYSCELADEGRPEDFARGRLNGTSRNAQSQPRDGLVPFSHTCLIGSFQHVSHTSGLLFDSLKLIATLDSHARYIRVSSHRHRKG